MRPSLRSKKIIVNQILFNPKYSKKEIEILPQEFPLGREKIQPPRPLPQLFIRRVGLGILDIDTQLNYKKLDSKVIKSHQCSLETFHALLIEINSEF